MESILELEEILSFFSPIDAILYQLKEDCGRLISTLSIKNSILLHQINVVEKFLDEMIAKIGLTKDEKDEKDELLKKYREFKSILKASNAPEKTEDNLLRLDSIDIGSCRTTFYRDKILLSQEHKNETADVFNSLKDNVNSLKDMGLKQTDEELGIAPPDSTPKR